MIVTSANLFTCLFDPNDVDSATGEIDIKKVRLEPCTQVIYTYPLPPQLTPMEIINQDAPSVDNVLRYGYMDILVVHSAALPATLRRFADPASGAMS